MVDVYWIRRFRNFRKVLNVIVGKVGPSCAISDAGETSARVAYSQTKK